MYGCSAILKIFDPPSVWAFAVVSFLTLPSQRLPSVGVWCCVYSNTYSMAKVKVVWVEKVVSFPSGHPNSLKYFFVKCCKVSLTCICVEVQQLTDETTQAWALHTPHCSECEIEHFFFYIWNKIIMKPFNVDTKSKLCFNFFSKSRCQMSKFDDIFKILKNLWRIMVRY